MRSALKNLVLDHSDLEKLEDALSQFNLFEAVGAIQSEIRHSNFLGFLLDPNERHALGDLFLKRFLLRALADRIPTADSIDPIELSCWDLDDTVVSREREYIDLLAENSEHKFVVLIENKIFAAEGAEQLQRYRIWGTKNYPSHKRVFIYLTPDAEEPSDPNWSPVGYQVICGIVADLLKSREGTLTPDVHTILSHYLMMLRRHIVSDSDLDLIKLAADFYKRHKLALDFIFEQRPDGRRELYELTKGMIEKKQDLVLEPSNNTYLRFLPKIWIGEIKERGKGWTSSGHVLLFELIHNEDNLRLVLTIGPGPQNFRQKIFDAFRASTNPRANVQQLAPNFSRIWAKSLLSKSHYHDATPQDLFDMAQKRFAEFENQDLPPILNLVAKVVA